MITVLRHLGRNIDAGATSHALVRQCELAPCVS